MRYLTNRQSLARWHVPRKAHGRARRLRARLTRRGCRDVVQEGRSRSEPVRDRHRSHGGLCSSPGGSWKCQWDAMCRLEHRGSELPWDHRSLLPSVLPALAGCFRKLRRHADRAHAVGARDRASYGREALSLCRTGALVGRVAGSSSTSERPSGGFRVAMRGTEPFRREFRSVSHARPDRALLGLPPLELPPRCSFARIARGRD